MDIKKIPIDSIGLSVRSQNALLRAGYCTLGDLLDSSEEKLNNIRNLGRKSVDEILQVIENYKGRADDDIDVFESPGLESPQNFEEWVQDLEHRKQVQEYLEHINAKVDELEHLSTRAYNLLLFGGYDTLSQVIFMTEEQLENIPRMDKLSAREIAEQANVYLKQIWNDVMAYTEQNRSTKDNLSPSIILFAPEYQRILKNYIRFNNVLVDRLELSSATRKKLKKNGCNSLLDFAFITPSALHESLALNQQAISEINRCVEAYIQSNALRITALCQGDVDALWDDDSLRNRIINIFNSLGFAGLSFSELEEKIASPMPLTPERLKKILGGLIQSGVLEYVDYRCYRIYPPFETYLSECTEIEPRNKEIIRKRLQGATLESVAQEYGLTRERVRQIVKKQVDKIRKLHLGETGMQYFDEDYYQYLYTSYDLDRNDSIKWLGISSAVWRYLEAIDLKCGKKDLHQALEDPNLEISLRLKIKNYLNRNRLYIDGVWVEKNRSELEALVVRKFCQEDTRFDDFMERYNNFLREEDVPYDEKLYYTEQIVRSRKNRMTDERYLLWKQNEMLRYYDVNSRDYSELLETLNLDAYENIEFSTEKFMRDYPELMQKYDIRDRYELHNLLKKIVKEGGFHDFHFGRMPNLQFGKFDRTKAFFEILKEMAPVTIPELTQAISDAYGYDPGTVMGSYLQPFDVYFHQGVYTVDQKEMPEANIECLKQNLTEDFYYFEEIKKIYQDLFPTADPEDINPFNLKKMGFNVLSRYALQHYSSLESYYEHLLTSEDTVDIRPYRKRFVSVMTFSQELMTLKRNLTVIEYAPNQLINIRKLEQQGVTKELLHEFCDDVYAAVEDGTYFSAQSLRLSGFQSNLYDLGFDDWFYANLLLSDQRFSFGNMFGTIVLYKGQKDITIQSFEYELIRKHKSVDILDLMTELEKTYGCNPMDKTDVYYKVQGTGVYYDRYLDRLYANEELYYAELDGEEM